MVKFVPFDKELHSSSHVNIFSGTNCLTAIGKLDGENKLELGRKCFNKQKVLRLLLYKIGLDNEELR